MSTLYEFYKDHVVAENAEWATTACLFCGEVNHYSTECDATLSDLESGLRAQFYEWDSENLDDVEALKDSVTRLESELYACKLNLNGERSVVTTIRSLAVSQEKALRSVEWTRWANSAHFCPWCRKSRAHGHADDCKRENVLSRSLHILD